MVLARKYRVALTKQTAEIECVFRPVRRRAIAPIAHTEYLIKVNVFGGRTFMRVFLAITLCLGFFVYGGARLVGASVIAVSASGAIDFLDVQPAVQNVQSLLDKTRGQQIIPLTAMSYFVYSAVMGLFLTIGAFGALSARRWGTPVMAVYFVMFGLMFLNLQIMNANLVHLGGALGLYLIQTWANDIRLI